MRDIRAVICQIQGHVPADERYLLYALEDLYASAGYYAPETQHLAWATLQHMLVDRFCGHPTLDWHFEVLSIFTTKSIGDIRQLAVASV